MPQLKPIWEKSFVVVNKEQHTGILCYCFSVEESQVDEAGNHGKDEVTTGATDAETTVEPVLKDVLSPTLYSEEDCFDQKLLVYKGRYYQEDVMVRVLHKKDPETSALCDKCRVRNTQINREDLMEITSSLSHSYIIKPLIVKCMSALSFMIVPCFKKSLKEVINSRQNLRQGTEEDVRFLSACLTDAVMYLHERLVIHRNICPLTVYLSSQGHIVLGCLEQAAKVRELGAYILGSCGTLGYQSPEVVAQLGYNHTVDFWGIGCVAYEFLFGIMPYVDADVSRMLSKTVLNPDFAFTRLGGRFTRLPKAAQEALRDGFLNRYPHKRTGFKLYEARQLRWFQPFRWDMIRQKQYKSSLQRFVMYVDHTSSPAAGSYPMSSHHCPYPKFSEKTNMMSHVLENESPSSNVQTTIMPGQYPVDVLSQSRGGNTYPRHVLENARQSSNVHTTIMPGQYPADVSSQSAKGKTNPRQVNHTAGMFDFQAFMQKNLPIWNVAMVKSQKSGINTSQDAKEEELQQVGNNGTAALNPLQLFIQKHFKMEAAGQPLQNIGK